MRTYDLYEGHLGSLKLNYLDPTSVRCILKSQQGPRMPSFLETEEKLRDRGLGNDKLGRQAHSPLSSMIQRRHDLP
jgi:hypothetical protein